MVKNTFETNIFKCVFKWILPISNAFAFIIINVKTLFNFEKELCTFDKGKKTFEKKIIVIVVVNMQKYSWSIINLHQVLNNETL
jgi:hypothetical protein